MKRFGIWVFYAVGVLAMLYLALYAYAIYRGRDFTPGDPIHIFEIRTHRVIRDPKRESPA